jgi:hypothetical protein
VAKKQQDELKKLSDEANAMAASTSLIRTEEGRALIALNQRLIEVLLHGEPKTKPVSRNHA